MNILQRLIGWFTTSPINFSMERYLSQSSDLADLEHRMKKWEYMSDSEKSRY